MLPSRLCGGLGAPGSFKTLFWDQVLGFHCRIESHAGVPPKNWGVACEIPGLCLRQSKCLRAVV